MMDFFIRLTLLEYFYCVCVCTTKRGPLIDLGFFFFNFLIFKKALNSTSI